ncbi:glycosyltransferase family 4 protein [Moorella sp. ACPs]|uniref:glycosyltransferase family 4 protein n=1 Tax=Neomoorella carbonis TaxID=3062783 RepID=UPI0032467455
MKQNLRIAMVYNGTFEYRTGILTVIENLTKQYLKAGHQVYNIGFTTGKSQKVRGWTLIPGMPLTLAGELKLALTVKKLIKEKDIDIVHFHGGQLLTLFKRHKIPYIVTNHGLLSKIYAENAGNDIKKSVFNIIGRYLYRGADVVTTVSSAVKDDITNTYRVDPSKIFVIPNGIDDFWLNDLPPGKINETRQKLGLADKGPILFFLRPAEKRKGLHFLLKSLGEIRGEFPDIRLLVAGQISDSDYTQEIRQLVTELHLDENVIFLGNVPQKDLPVFYKMAYLTVVPSTYEAFPMVILESYACGTPVVAFDAGGVRDIIEDGIDGWIIQWGDSEGLTRIVFDLLSKPDMLKEMGKRGKEKVKGQYRWSSIAESYIKVYKLVGNA